MMNEQAQVKVLQQNKTLAAQQPEKKTMWEKVKEHKEDILLVGTIALGTFLLVKNWDELNDFLCSLNKNKTQPKTITVQQSVPALPGVPDKIPDCEDVVTKTINVIGHVRNMANRNASQKQIALAEAAGIVLEEHQTYISPYSYEKAVA